MTVDIAMGMLLVVLMIFCLWDHTTAERKVDAVDDKLDSIYDKLEVRIDWVHDRLTELLERLERK